LIQRVYECACDSSADSVTIATDDPGIFRVAESFGANVCMTSDKHNSGTDRVAEAAIILKLDDQRIVVNLQGDEPRMPGSLIDQVAETLAADPLASLATACQPLDHQEEYENPDIVKVVRDRRNVALYFSRAAIPSSGSSSHNQGDGIHWSIIRRHIGLYAYRVNYLKHFLQQDCVALERAEQLEQLRALWNGDSILVCDAVQTPGPGVDTLADLEEAILYFS
jgi:3-deoxy-manno-octulosonate cytidylyltransferase (CMP-KDO synthetase)